MESMDARLVAQALNYHGQQLQKVWEGERNENELVMLNLKEPNFEIYQQRQKTLSFGDRGKRLKLQQFLAKKADALYDKSNLEKTVDPLKQELGDEEFYATMPGLDTFVTMEKSQRIRNFLECLVIGDVIYAQVMGKSAVGLLLKVLCNCSDCPRVVTDLGVKALILNTATVPAVDKKGVTRSYMANDLICVVVSEVNVEAERVVAVMNVPAREGQAPHPPMGLIHSDDLPEAYKKAMDNKGQSYEAMLENSTGFNNPNNIRYLCELMGLGQENHSNMVGLRERFPPNEYASELRQAQASKWAFRSVAEGIDHFKAGRHTEAFQCLNKALTVDPRNVEGLVARGALYANSGSFKKAIDDFETALKLNQTHTNARKYMAETLVALGRSYEDEKKYEDAQKAYENCLAIAPFHEEARNSIEYIKSKTLSSSLNPLDTFKSFETENDVGENKKEKKKRKKERKSRSKKRQRWSSSSSSSSSGSSSSSSSESSSSSSSASSRSASRSPSRKRKHKKDHRGSLSPLSKRMAQYNNPPAATTAAHDVIAPVSYSSNTRDKMDDYEIKVRKFLEQTKDDSDYEDKVRKFLEETARWKREREKEKKHSESEKMKKKKKKEKKGKDKEKDDKKSRKKKKKEERKKRKNKDKLERDLEALKKSSLPDLEQLESKLNAYYAKVEKETAVLKRYVAQYNDIASPLSNAEKLAESSRREEELRRERERERDEASKAYHEREARVPMTAQQRKEIQRKPLTDIFEQESQLIHPEPKLPTLDTAALNAKWKAAQAARQKDVLPQKWQDVSTESKKMQSNVDSDEDDDNELEEKLQRAALEKSMNIRKQMQRELAEKRAAAAQPMSAPTPPPLPKEPPMPKQAPVKYPTPQPQNKFQSYKDPSISAPQTTPTKFSSSNNLGGKFQPIGQSGNSGAGHPPEPPRPPPPVKNQNQAKGPRTDSDSETERQQRQTPKKRESSGRGGAVTKRMSRDRPAKRSRSRSRSASSSGSSRSRSPRRSRSRSYSNRRSGSYERKYSRSPSGTYSRSRSRSRSRSYTRSRSRSRSGDRSYYRKRQFRPYNNRGTYYKPRFQGFNNPNHRGGGNNFQNRNRFYNNQHNNRFGNRRGGGFNNRGGGRGRGGNRGGRFFHGKQGFRDFRDRREFRDRRAASRDRYSDRSYSPDPMRKVDEAKEKINKMLEGGDDVMEHQQGGGGSNVPPSKRQDGPLSEGEERDDDDYERWGEGEGGDTANKNEEVGPVDDNLEGKEYFIERMKQRSKNVLMQRTLAAKVW